MRSKKVQYKNMRKHRNKKSKKCNCGLKLPFLKWGGDVPTAGPTGQSNPDLSQKLTDLLSETSKKVTGDLGELTTASKNAINNVTDSTQSVIDDTTNHVTKNTKDILDKTQNNAKTTTDKASDFFTGIIANASNSLHELTKPKTITTTTNRGSIPSKPETTPPKSTTSTSSTSSLSSSSSKTGSLSTMSNGSNKSTQQSNSGKYANIAKYRNLLKKSSNNNNSNIKQGGRRRTSKKPRSRKPRKPRKQQKSRKSKRRHMYKYKGGSGSGCMDGPVGIEKSYLASTASPTSNINAVGPRPDQMIGQTAYSPLRFSE